MATYMEIKITPKKIGLHQSKEQSTPVLILPPFNKPPTVEFKNVKVGTSATQMLVVRNLSTSRLQVEISKIPPAERGLSISPGKFSLEAQQEVRLEIQWHPLDKGNWRDVVQFKAGRVLQLDVVFLLSADAPGKGKKMFSKPLSTQNANIHFASKKSKVCPIVSGDSVGLAARSSKVQQMLTVISEVQVNIPVEQFWEDKENIESFSPVASCSHTFTQPSFDSSFRLPDITAFTPVHRETYTLTVDHTPDCVAVSDVYQITDVYSDLATRSSSSSEHYPDSLNSDDIVRAPDDAFKASKQYCELKNLSLGLDGSFNSKLRDIKLDESGLHDAMPSPKNSNKVCDLSFTMGASLPTDSLDFNPPVRFSASGPVLLEISPPKLNSIRKYVVNRPKFAKSSQRFHRETVTKVLKSKSVKMKHTKRTQVKALKNLKLLPAKCKEKVVALLSPVCAVPTSKRGMWGISNAFRGSSVYQTEAWMVNQEREFTKWLNALLTPPAQLDCYTSIPTVDVVELWKKSCRSKSVELAPSREAVSSRYNTHNRLDRLRQAAKTLFYSDDVKKILRKVTSHVNKKMICIRPDKIVYKDVGLRRSIVELLLSYNPLWLRIGLEALYMETIPLRSNSDILGLETFIRTRVLSDPYTVEKFTYPRIRNYYMPGFEDAINKFVLKKLIFLIYLLDLAKNSKLISHNPCLFCKNSKVKKSRDVLVVLTREIISKMGDITSYLQHLGYVVTHEQTYLDEYDYAVTNLSQDLRDGIRLTHMMEIILQKTDLSKQLRYPPISLLQKKHNVGVALAALKHHGYVLEDDISVKDIAEGHREKTLSLLWQRIYKFEEPLFSEAAIVIQKWWRSRLQRRVNAAVIIQKAWIHTI